MFFVVSVNMFVGVGVVCGVDVLYCGGMLGFVCVDDVCMLMMFDFSGNWFFNMFGNL